MHAVHLVSSFGISLLPLELAERASLVICLTLLRVGAGDDNALHLASTALLTGLLVGCCGWSLGSVD